MEKFIFKEKTEAQLKAKYYKRETRSLNGFKNFDDFKSWYIEKDKKCRYCKISESEVQEIVVLGLLKSKRFPENGRTSQGRARGMWLEVDRFNPNEKYSRENCVLACYFCNNDKSDVFVGSEYLDFYQNRAQFLKNLIKN